MATKLQITQHKSANGTNHSQRETLRSLGLGRIGQSTEREDSQQLRGMLRTVDHLVRVGESGKAKD